MARAKPKNPVVKSRYYTFIVYLDSADPNWKINLENLQIPAIVSPFHDKDLNANGEPKKSHYHVLLMYDGPTSFSLAQQDYVNIVGHKGCVGDGFIRIVRSKRGMGRYLCHLDNPDKALYSIKDVSCYFGADYTEFTNSPSDRYSNMRMMSDFIINYKVTSFAWFYNYCADNNQSWFELLCDSCTYVMRELIKSNCYESFDDSQVKKELNL